ncbi:TPA: hypothetical protein N0F65_011674 [Lagenidium giganteum]|uniref:Uncharacterized protein n=1 Tax=Lagenidium giganteum TaxID=4803 RepID=A0AAV2ZBK5_9STRA|nr:TPA: hypothetical protein N0F65_011674 [Lagenidium giganteum]
MRIRCVRDLTRSLFNAGGSIENRSGTCIMRQMLKLLLHHPGWIGFGVVVISVFYEYARILVLQYVLGALQYSIHRYPNNFPPAFFIPFFYISTTVAFFAAIYHDCVLLHAGWWMYVLSFPLTLQGRLYRIVGVPCYAFAIGVVEAIQVFRNPSMQSDLGRLGVYLELLNRKSFLDEIKVQALIADLRWRAWSIRTTNPTIVSYIRLPIEVLACMFVCFVYGLALFCSEPRHDGEELREATRNNDVERVRVILRRGVNPNSRASDGATALHICAQQAMPSIAKVLFEHKADPNKADRLGFTPLHWAVQMRREEVSSTNRLEMIRMLLQNGADPKKPDTGGTTPLTIASKKENSSSMEVLREVLGDTTEPAEAVSHHTD